jgi:HEAT repeat protein
MSIVAAYQESIGPAVPQIIALLSHNNEDVRSAGADAFEKLSEQGKICNVLVWDY